MADDLSSFIESQKRKLEQERAEILRTQEIEVRYVSLISLLSLQLDIMSAYVKNRVCFWFKFYNQFYFYFPLFHIMIVFTRHIIFSVQFYT